MPLNLIDDVGLLEKKGPTVFDLEDDIGLFEPERPSMPFVTTQAVTGAPKTIVKGVVAGVGDIAQAAKAVEEHIPEAERIEAERAGRIIPRPRSAKEIQYMNKWLKSLGREPTAEEYTQKLKEYQSVRQVARTIKLENFIDLLPEPVEPKSKVEAAVYGMARFLPSMGVTAVNPLAGFGMTFAQLMGQKYGELTDAGVDNDTAYAAAVFSGLAQAPIEFAGNLIQIRGLTGLYKAFKPSRQIARKITRFVTALGRNALAEGAEEFLQQYPDEAANIFAQNPNKTPKEIGQIFVQRLGEITSRAAEAGEIGAIGGALLAGAGGGGAVIQGERGEEVQPLPPEELEAITEQPTRYEELSPDQVETFKTRIQEKINAQEIDEQELEDIKADFIQTPSLVNWIDDTIDQLKTETIQGRVENVTDDILSQADAVEITSTAQAVAEEVQEPIIELPENLRLEVEPEIVEEPTVEKPVEVSRGELNKIASDIGDIRYDDYSEGVGYGWTVMAEGPAQKASFTTKAPDIEGVRKAKEATIKRFEPEKPKPAEKEPAVFAIKDLNTGKIYKAQKGEITHTKIVDRVFGDKTDFNVEGGFINENGDFITEPLSIKINKTKLPYQLTKKEYRTKLNNAPEANRLHRNEVLNAKELGKPIPPEVQAEYPEIFKPKPVVKEIKPTIFYRGSKTTEFKLSEKGQSGAIGTGLYVSTSQKDAGTWGKNLQEITVKGKILGLQGNAPNDYVQAAEQELDTDRYSAAIESGDQVPAFQVWDALRRKFGDNKAADITRKAGYIGIEHATPRIQYRKTATNILIIDPNAIVEIKPKPPQESISGEGLEGKIIKRKAVHEKTGKETTIKQNAQEAVNEIDEQISLYEKILNCLTK